MTEPVKAAVIYYSATGNVYQLARAAIEGARKAAFCSTSTAHGGQASTLLSLATTFYHWGGILVPPGYTDEIQFASGNPHGASHVSADGRPPGETELAAARYQARRAVEVAGSLVSR